MVALKLRKQGSPIRSTQGILFIVALATIANVSLIWVAVLCNFSVTPSSSASPNRKTFLSNEEVNQIVATANQTEEVTKPIDDTTKTLEDIPKVIHIMGKRWLKEMDSWKKLNPGYTVEFYNDQRCNQFIKDNYSQYEFTYNHLKSVRKFDFLRYLMIYHFGGIYADSDITCLVPIKDWGLRNDTAFFTGMECVGCNDIGIQAIQWTFGATPKHPILKHIVNSIVANAMKAPKLFEVYGKLNKVIHMTGPSAFSDGINTYLMEMGTCDPEVNRQSKGGAWTKCKSIDHPNLFASGVQMFPWYRWGAAKNGLTPEKPLGLLGGGTGKDAGKFIKHGYKGSWVNKG